MGGVTLGKRGQAVKGSREPRVTKREKRHEETISTLQNAIKNEQREGASPEGYAFPLHLR